MAEEKMRIYLKSYDCKLIDSSAKKIVEIVKKTGAKISGPVPLPTKIVKQTVIRSPHKYKDSREQFEMRTHKRMIEISETNQNTISELTSLNLASGVGIEIKQI